MSASIPSELTGKLLIAMPSMSDPRFGGAVIYMCAHSAEGAMGLVINQPAEDVSIDDVYDQLDIDLPPLGIALNVHIGGPVEIGRGFVLHDGGYTHPSNTLVVDDDFAMTASQRILQDMAIGAGPKKSLFCLGYSGWGPRQLEEELSTNGWLICDADPQLVFDLASKNKWEAAVHSLGVDPALLSATGGQA